MMKRYLFLLAIACLFISPTSFAQSGKVFYIDKLSKQDTLLSGWKFQAGDNPQWAAAAYDDSKWQAADPGTDITKFDQLKNAGVGWLRLHIRADSAIAWQRLMAWVSQYSASEIYLDGKLIQRYGYISHDPAKTIAVIPAGELFELKLKGGVNQVIAVRVGYQSRILYVSPLYVPLPAFSMYINGYKAATTNSEDLSKLNQEQLVMYSIAAGIFLILCLIHLLYFIFDRSQKISLYYLIYCLSVFYIYLTFVFIFYQGHSETLSTYMLIFFAGIICFCTAFLFLVLVVYVLFGYHRRTVFKVLAILALLVALGIFLDDIIGAFIDGVVFPVLCMLEVARICFLALKQKRKDATVIFPVICLYIILLVWEGLLDQTTILATLLYYFVFLSLPIAIAIYLAFKTASTNRALKATLAEVRMLSEQKQQILADQNTVLEWQVSERTAELNQSLTHLKATQTQLIQSEKMASLGELTAGIAHEIQNPLNFINNFSELNTELVGEIKQEIEKGDLSEIKAIAVDIEENSKKINMHGKRADAIVKGMLQHSQVGSGTKESTNINALAEECMRLSYHGLRAKDASFSAEMVSHLDEKLPKVNVIPQDMVRVMLNLFNNSFYAVNQKAKTAGADYKPEVSVYTSAENGQAVIKVKDNGVGIPDAIKEKIMQPFFTTKPTGEGTGLGLSLTYDMVVKGHGGTIQVNSVEGEGSEFTIQLPINMSH